MVFRLHFIVLVGLLVCAGCKNREAPIPTTTHQEIPKIDLERDHRIVPDSLNVIEINGDSLHYVERGKGDPLIFIHGSISDYRVWSGYIEPYSKNYHTIVYSRRYAWPNKQVYDSLADYSVRIHADDLYELIQKMDLGKVHLVGHSYGAFTALTLAVDHPELVRSMVLGEPPALFLANNSEINKENLLYFKENHFRPAAKEFKAGNTEKGLEYFVGGANNNPGFKLSDVPEKRKAGWMRNILELKGNAISEPDFELNQTAIADLNIPVLLFVGDKSPQWLTALSGELHKLLPNSKLDTLTDSAHGLYFQQPAQANKAMLAFFAEQ